MYFLLSGKPPFEAKNLRKMLEEIPKKINAVLQKINSMDISSQCKDLLKQLFIFDPKKRMDTQKFFAHPFVKTIPQNYRTLIEKIPTVICEGKPGSAPYEEIKEKKESFVHLTDSGSPTVFYKSSSENSSLACSPKNENMEFRGVFPDNKV